MVDLLRQFGNDPETIAIGALIIADIILGISAALVSDLQRFNMTYIADFLRNDILQKFVPYALLWGLFHVTGDVQLGGLELLETGTSSFIILALAGSILKSLAELGINIPVPQQLKGDDPNTAGAEAVGPPYKPNP